VVLLGLPSSVLANHGDALLLGQQVITASRTGHSPVSIASSSLITRDEIERQQARQRAGAAAAPGRAVYFTLRYQAI